MPPEPHDIALRDVLAQRSKSFSQPCRLWSVEQLLRGQSSTHHIRRDQENQDQPPLLQTLRMTLIKRPLQRLLRPVRMPIRPQKPAQIIQIHTPLRLWIRTQRRTLHENVLENLSSSSGFPTREEDFKAEVCEGVDAASFAFGSTGGGEAGGGGASAVV